MDAIRSISDSFSRAAQTYDQYAEVQSYAAHVCGQKMHDLLPKLPAGPVLEIGCGTGFLTQQLVEHCNGRQIIAADVSPDMLTICKSRIDGRFRHGHSVSFELLDAQCLAVEPRFALIAASFSFQWFANLTETLDRLMHALLPGGRMLFSFPTCESFSEWRSVCEKSGHEFSGNTLPDVASLRAYAARNGYEFKSYEMDYVLRYDSPLDFFKALRHSGATTKFAAAEPGSASQLFSVVRAWERDSEPSAQVTYRILFGSMSAGGVIAADTARDSGALRDVDALRNVGAFRDSGNLFCSEDKVC
jgi:malonyl-CoA O-methyltransferase